MRACLWQRRDGGGGAPSGVRLVSCAHLAGSSGSAVRTCMWQRRYGGGDALDGAHLTHCACQQQ